MAEAGTAPRASVGRASVPTGLTKLPEGRGGSGGTGQEQRPRWAEGDGEARPSVNARLVRGWPAVTGGRGLLAGVGAGVAHGSWP